MAFMIPVVRNDWDVWKGSGKTGDGKKLQNEQKRNDETSSSAPGSTSIFMKNTHRKRTLAIEICNQQHLRHSSGSLPSSFQTTHLTLPHSGNSPIRNHRPCSITSRLDSVHVSGTSENHGVFEPESLASSTHKGGEPSISKPLGSEVIPTIAKTGSQNSLQRFHIRLVDRLRRSLRHNSGSTSDGGEICDTDKGSRASS